MLLKGWEERGQFGSNRCWFIGDFMGGIEAGLIEGIPFTFGSKADGEPFSDSFGEDYRVIGDF